jgi:hypothetical protein
MPFDNWFNEISKSNVNLLHIIEQVGCERIDKKDRSCNFYPSSVH